MNEFQTRPTPISVLVRLLLPALLLTLSACGTVKRGPASNLPWYVGEFQSSPSQDKTQMQMSVSCKSGQACDVYSKQGDAPSKPMSMPDKKPPTRFDPGIPNNNLELTRRAVNGDPALYQDPNFGALLRPLRAVLESRAKFAECLDLDGTQGVALCSLFTDPRAARSAMLLFITMNPTCGKDLPFCAYYFMPLERVRTR